MLLDKLGTGCVVRAEARRGTRLILSQFPHPLQFDLIRIAVASNARCSTSIGRRGIPILPSHRR